MAELGRFLSMLIIAKIVLNTNSTILRYDSKMYADFSILLDDLADNGSIFKSFTLKTRRECVLECLSLLRCKSLNHKKDGGNCELIERSLNGSTPLLISRAGWTYLTTNDEDPDTGPTCKMLSPCQNSGICVDTEDSSGFKCSCSSLFSGKYCEAERAFTSCKAVFEAGFRNNGIYMLENMGHHYCRLTSITGCSDGGWTQILKTDGSKTTFDYHASYWTTNNVYNHIYTLNDGLWGQEAKFDAFNKLSFTKVCIAMRHQSEIKFLELPRAETSMLSLTQSGTYKSTYVARSKWLSLISGGAIQANCNQQGFNNKWATDRYVRIGIFGNGEADCNTIDSVLGIGIGGHYNHETHIKTGVHSAFEVFSRIQAKGNILVQ